MSEKVEIKSDKELPSHQNKFFIRLKILIIGVCFVFCSLYFSEKFTG